ncbi:hypothetical protein EMCRGX_G013595 [Ephydatia muelleri]
MSLRNDTAQGGVSSLDRLKGNVTLEPGPGMTIIDNATTNSIRLSTTSQSVNLDTVLQNGDRSARTINLLTNVADTFPTLSLHDNISLGNSKTIPDVSISYTDETPSGLKMTSGNIFRSDIIGAAVASSIQSKSGITIDPGMQLKTDYIDASTTGGKLQLNDVQLAMDKTLYTDNIRPNPSSPTRFINTGGIAVDPTYSVKASAYLPSGAYTNAAMFRADDGTIVSTGTLSIDAAVQVLPNKLLKCDVVTSSTDSNDKLTFNMPAGIIGAPNIFLNPVTSVQVLAGKPINCDQIIDTTSTKMVVDLANTTIQSSQVILQSDTQIQNFKTANISGLNADSGITINAPIGGIGLTPTTVLSTDTIHAVSTDNQVNFTSHLSVDPKLHIKVKNVVSDSDILLNPVGDVVVDPGKILKTVNIRSVSDVVPITMSSDAMRVAGAVKKAGAALGAALGGASAGVTLQAVGPALLQAVAALLLAVAEGPALLQAVAGLLLAVAEGPALLQAVAGLLLAVAVGPALLQAALLLAVAVGPALLQAAGGGGGGGLEPYG